MLLEHLISTLCTQLNLPRDLTKNPQGHYSIKLNDDITLSLKELNPGFSCTSELTPLPSSIPEELLILLMKANFLGQGTQRSALAIDQNLKHFILTLCVPEDVQDRLFKEALEEFVNYATYWKKTIDAHLTNK